MTTLGSDFESSVPVDTREFVSWPELLLWASHHGAINDRITSIEISTTRVDGEIRGVVTFGGYALNEKGKPYTIGPGYKNAARWQVTNQLLRWLP